MEGCAGVGVCRPEGVGDAGARLAAWLETGANGDMGYMAERVPWRADPRAMWPDVRSILMCAENYGPSVDPLEITRRPSLGAISVYAQGRDYHDVFKKRLKRIARWFVETTGAQVKVFVDTAPVMEKPLAAAAGLGWQGKHTNVVSRSAGSWTFLGAIFTDADLPPDSPHADRCGGCRRCLDICPTQAFLAPYQLDARRCVSYLTIEHKGPIPRDLRPGIGNRIYGCDDCLAVCPWNKFAQQAAEIAYRPRAELTAPELADLATLDDATFREVFSGSPIKRIGRDRFVRNVLIAVGNSRDPALIPAAEALLDDPSPLVRGAAVWALNRLDPQRLKAAAARIQTETDPDVQAEWAAAMGRRTDHNGAANT